MISLDRRASECIGLKGIASTPSYENVTADQIVFPLPVSTATLDKNDEYVYKLIHAKEGKYDSKREAGRNCWGWQCK
jgi:hypothetical protein